MLAGTLVATTCMRNYTFRLVSRLYMRAAIQRFTVRAWTVGCIDKNMFFPHRNMYFRGGGGGGGGDVSQTHLGKRFFVR